MEINATEMIRTTGAFTELDLLYKRLIYTVVVNNSHVLHFKFSVQIFVRLKISARQASTDCHYRLYEASFCVDVSTVR